MSYTVEKPRAFFYHYNKPASKKSKTPKLSVHYKGQCHIVDGILCRVPTRSHVRKRQPRVVIKGFGIMSINKSGMAIIV